MQELVSQRLRLRPLVAADACRVFAALSDVRLYEFLDGVPPATLAELESRFQRWEARRSPAGEEIWLNWIAERLADGRPVAWFQATILPGQGAELAYVVFHEHQRHGFGYEGSAHVLRHLFEDLGCREVIVRMDARNTPSIRLAARLGFVRIERTAADALRGHPEGDYILKATRAPRPLRSPHWRAAGNSPRPLASDPP